MFTFKFQHLGVRGRKIFVSWGQCGLYGEFQDSQSYIVRPCLQNKTKPKILQINKYAKKLIN